MRSQILAPDNITPNRGAEQKIQFLAGTILRSVLNPGLLGSEPGFGQLRLPARASRDDLTMVGILVHGDNHFIVRGPLPDRNAALALVRHWSLIRIGVTTPPSLDQWHIISREFRENLEWAVVVLGDGELSPAVTSLLGAMSARGITIHNSRLGLW